MKLFSISVLIFLCFRGNILIAQKEDYVWTMGYESNTDTSEYAMRFGGTDIDFNTEPPSLFKVYRDTYFRFTSSSLSDTNGRLLVYTNGCSVGEPNNKIIDKKLIANENTLVNTFCDYGFNFEQGCIILRSSDEIHVFHTDLNLDQNLIYKIDTFFLTTLKYDNIGNNFKIINERNPLIIGEINAGRFTAVRHSNGMKWWIIVPSRNKNIYYKLLMSDSELLQKETQQIGTKHNPIKGTGQDKFSPNGKKYAKFNPYEGLDIYDFDRTTGLFSNAIHLPYWRNPEEVIVGGLEFSPNSQYLYISALDTIWQFDVLDPEPFSTKTLVGAYDGFTEEGLGTGFFMMQIAPNNKIYMSCTNGTRYLHTIHNPDQKGISCDFRQHDLMLPTYNAFTMPYFPNFRLGSEIPDATSNITYLQFILSPNPANTEIYIQSAQSISRVEIFDVQGMLMISTHDVNVDVSQLVNGVYIVKVWSEDGRIGTSKFIKV